MLIFYPNKELREARTKAQRRLWSAQEKFAEADLRLRLGRKPSRREVLGWAYKNPTVVFEINQASSLYRRSRKARWQRGEPLGPQEGTYRARPQARFAPAPAGQTAKTK